MGVGAAAAKLDELRLVAINGMLGYGYELASLENGIAAEPHLFGVDAGFTDAGRVTAVP